MGWPLYNFDVTAAYLRSLLDHDFWVRQPPGFSLAAAGKVLKCLKALYGTKQAGRCWWKFIAKKLSNMGFTPSQFDNSFYVLKRGTDVCMVWIHVDDGAVTSSNPDLLAEVEAEMSTHIKIKWECKLTNIVGVAIEHLSPNHYVLSQPGLAEKILRENSDLLSPLSANTPLSASTRLETDMQNPPLDGGRYLSIVGSLGYLAVGTRPDLSFLVNFLARYAKTPREAHWNALKHLRRFLRKTSKAGIDVSPTASAEAAPMETFVDANWGGEFARSSYGHVTRLFGIPIAWVARRQACVATSTCHSEFMAIGAACRDSVCLHSLASDVLEDLPCPMLLCDNSCSVHVSTDNAANKRTRHAEREFYYMNEQLFKNCVSLRCIPAREQVADILTKPLGPLNHKEARKLLKIAY